MKYSEQQLNDMARSMALGTQGSFARHLGEAFLVADSGNRQTILEAFKGLFDRVARFKGIESTFDEAKHEAFMERRMNMLDKKLMQGHISQDDYESMVNDLKDFEKYLKEETV
jgi:hypothetical protein